MDDDLINAVNNLADAVRAIAHGGLSGPAGLEGLTMAITGEGSPQEVTGGLAEALSTGLSAIAEAQREGLVAIAEAIADRVA